MKYVVISDNTTPFLLGRYETLEKAKKAVGDKSNIWLIYKLVE